MDIQYERAYHAMERTNWWFRAHRQLILWCLKHLKSRKILDVGCSSGATMEFLESRGFSDVYGIDISKKAIKECKKRNLRAFCASADRTSFKNGFFDTLVASDVLEHTSSDALTFREWSRILRSRGNVILFVPAFMHLWTAHDELNHHRKRYRLSEIYALAKKHGFVVKRASYWNVLLYPLHFVITRIKNLFNIRTASLKPTNPVINFIMFLLLSLENILIMCGLCFPFGISCFAILEKPC